MKFILGRKEFDQPLNFSSAETAVEHPLAHKLFALGSIYNVLMAQDFVTINKLPTAPWEPLLTEAAALITDYFDL